MEIHDFSITQILCEIKFGNSRSTKSAIFTHLEAMDFDFYEFSYFLKAEIYLIYKIQQPKMTKKTTSKFSKIDFT